MPIVLPNPLARVAILVEEPLDGLPIRIWRLGSAYTTMPALSQARHELLMDLIERHGALEELGEAERRETPSEQDVEEAAGELGVRSDVTGRPS